MQVHVRARRRSLDRLALVSLLALSLALSLVERAQGGANAGGYLFLYANDAIRYTSDQSDYAGLSGVECAPDESCPPYDDVGCDARLAQAGSGYVSYLTDTTIVFWVIAAWSPNTCPRMKGAQFGIDYDPDEVSIVSHGTDASFELSTSHAGLEWPAPKTGTALSWDQAQTAPCKEVYWFAAEVGSNPSEIMLAPHPAGNTWPTFADDSVPSALDPIDGDCLMGLGVAGSLGGECHEHFGGDDGACCLPGGTCEFIDRETCIAGNGIFDGSQYGCVVSFCSSVAVGACCLSSEDACVLRTGEDCQAATGSYYGDWTACEPLFCTTAITRESWGAIKHRYR